MFMVIGFGTLALLALMVIIPITVMATTTLNHEITVHLTGDTNEFDINSGQMLEANQTLTIVVPQGQNLTEALLAVLDDQVAIPPAFRTVFNGWYLDARLSVPLDPTSFAARDLTVWAAWNL